MISAYGIKVDLSQAEIITMVINEKARSAFSQMQSFLDNSSILLLGIDALKEATEWLREYGSLEQFQGTAADMIGTMGAVLEKMDSVQRCTE